MLRNLECNGGLIFILNVKKCKILKCKKRCYEFFLIYTFGIQYNFIYFGLYLLNPHDKTVQNMYGKDYIKKYSKIKIVAKILANTALILLATRILPASNFGQAKHCQKGPAATFCRKVFVPLCILAFSPFMGHHNISLGFRAGGQREENFNFSQICMSVHTQTSFGGLLRPQF